MLAEDAVLARWVALGRTGESLTAADRQAVLDRIRCGYQARGLAEPGTIVWAGSPGELNRRWEQRVGAQAGLVRRIRVAPVPSLIQLAVRAGWLTGHVLLAVLVAVVPPALLLLLSLPLHRAFGPPGDVVTVIGAVLLCCIAGPLWDAVVSVMRHAFDPAGWGRSSRWARPSPGPEQPLIEEGPGPQADPVPGWIGSESLLVICEPPRTVRTESVGAAGRRRLHHESGPAVEWDGHSGQERPGYYLHGVAIPDRLFLTPTVERIHRESNSEVRRLVIERMGWLRYIEDAGLRLVAAVPDPGNPGHQLRLYDLPKSRFEPVRLLLMVNGSPDRSGDRRRYAELVPAWIDDPVQAVAWQYGCPVDTYRQLARRT
jgi:hypothetical protein